MNWLCLTMIFLSFSSAAMGLSRAHGACPRPARAWAARVRGRRPRSARGRGQRCQGRRCRVRRDWEDWAENSKEFQSCHESNESKPLEPPLSVEWCFDCTVGRFHSIFTSWDVCGTNGLDIFSAAHATWKILYYSLSVWLQKIVCQFEVYLVYLVYLWLASQFTSLLWSQLEVRCATPVGGRRAATPRRGQRSQGRGQRSTSTPWGLPKSISQGSLCHCPTSSRWV